LKLVPTRPLRIRGRLSSVVLVARPAPGACALDVFLLGPLPKTIARRAAAAGPDGLLFPYPSTDRLWSESEYRNWREDYFVPIARGHGLGNESDDPSALRHIYATLRIAAHHPTLYIESSMGTSLIGRVYGGVIRKYAGKGALDIGREIRAARKPASAAPFSWRQS
jgi:hypothetical protein